MAITQSTVTFTVKAVEQAYVGGTAVTKVIATATPDTTTKISLCDENSKVEFTMFAGTAPAVNDTINVVIG